MTLRDLWQGFLTENFAPEFGPEIAAELAVLPLRTRRVRIREWYRSHPSSSISLVLPGRWSAVHFKLQILHTIAAEQGQHLTPGAAATIARQIAVLEEILNTQESEPRKPEMALSVAEEHLRRAERALAYASVAAREVPRPFSIEGEMGLQNLKLKAGNVITRKCRVQLLLDDFERYHERVAEKDRPNVDRWLGKLRDLHRAYAGIVNRMREVLWAEEDMVRKGFAADLNAFDRFNAELVTFDRQYGELRGKR